jgi:DNA invertase Pin-like site-specific DNA recombinase
VRFGTVHRDVAGSQRRSIYAPIYAALAEQERTLISQRTKAALAAAKARRGVKLGNPNLAAIRDSGGEAGKAEADRFANNVLPIIAQVRKAGALTLQQIADALNDRSVATARGGSWYPSNVRNFLPDAERRGGATPGSRPGVDPGGGRGGYRADFENR